MNITAPILQVAAKAILVNPEGKILILREASTYEEGTNVGKWHQPGGRVRPEEDYKDGLRREVEEETGIDDIKPLYPVHVDDWRPVIKGVEHHIVGIFMICKTKTSAVRLSEEHDKYKWIEPSESEQYELLDAEQRAVDAYVRFGTGKS